MPLSSWEHGLENLHRFLEHINSLHPSIKFTLEMQKEDKTIPFLDVLLIIQKDGSLGHKVYRKPTHTDRYLHYNSFYRSSIKNSVCKTLINRAKTICEVDNIEGELEHLRSVLKMNGYLKKFIDNAIKIGTRSVHVGSRKKISEVSQVFSGFVMPYLLHYSVPLYLLHLQICLLGNTLFPISSHPARS